MQRDQLYKKNYKNLHDLTIVPTFTKKKKKIMYFLSSHILTCVFNYL